MGGWVGTCFCFPEHVYAKARRNLAASNVSGSVSASIGGCSRAGHANAFVPCRSRRPGPVRRRRRRVCRAIAGRSGILWRGTRTGDIGPGGGRPSVQTLLEEQLLLVLLLSRGLDLAEHLRLIETVAARRLR